MKALCSDITSVKKHAAAGVECFFPPFRSALQDEQIVG